MVTAMTSQRARMQKIRAARNSRMNQPGSAWASPWDFIVFGSIVTPITGANSTATIHEASRATAMTANSE